MSEMTYSSLLSDVQKYADRNDEPFVSQIPSLVSLAENRIATEVHALGYRKFVATTLLQDQSISPKPATWRETVSFRIGTGAGNLSGKFLLYRGYEYLRAFWKDSSQTEEPRYYSDYDYEHYLIAPTPNMNYPAEICYHERPLPLSIANQQNWTTIYAPQLLLYATLLEAQPFLMKPERTAEFQALYDRSAAAIMNEEKRRLLDDSAVRRDK